MSAIDLYEKFAYTEVAKPDRVRHTEATATQKKQSFFLVIKLCRFVCPLVSVPRSYAYRLFR